MKKLLIAACAVAITMVACKDDDDKTTTPTPSTPSAALTGKDWRLTSSVMTVKGPGVDTTYDEFNEMDPCEKDNLTRFNDDKTVVEKAGATKCNPSDPDSETIGTWSLSADNKKLTVTPTGEDPETVDVVTLNETTLVVSATQTTSGYTTTIKMTHTKN